MAPRALTTYRLLLRLFPAAFRDRFGGDMADVFADRLHAARRRGNPAVIALWWRTTIDVIAHAAAERRRTPRVRDRLRGFMRALLDDVVTAVRGHLRRPGLLLLAAPMLAVGIGFNSGLFALVYDVILHPLPYAEPDRLMLLWTGRNPDGSGGANSYADYTDWKARNHSFESLATYNIALRTLTDGGDPEEIGGAVVSPEFFQVLGVRMRLGRGLVPGDELIQAGNGQPVVIADSLWARRFHRDPQILERSIVFDGHPRRVVGVVSPEFVEPEPSWSERTEFWSPLVLDPASDRRTNRAFRYLRVIGRLLPGVSPTRAAGEMDGIGQALMKAYPSTNSRSVVLVSIANELEQDTRTAAWIFLGAAGLVLALGIANVVNLLLARANDRRAELALRVALGASRGRITWQLVADSTVVGLAGGLLGLALADLGIHVLLAYAPPDLTGPAAAPGMATIHVDWTVAAFALALSTFTGAAAGLLPAWRVARARLTGPVGQRGSAGLETARMRRWLVSAEVALALPLIVGAGLLTRTLIGIEHVNPGFDASHALQFRISASGTRYEKDAARIAFFTRLGQQLRAEPGVTDVGLVSSLPMGGLNNTGATIVYEGPDGTAAELSVGFRAATAGYFTTLHIPLRTGRLFDASATDTSTVVVNDLAAAAMWGDGTALGRRIRFGTLADPAGKPTWLTVVGVVGSLRHEALTRLPNPEIFQPYQANPWSTMTVVARTTGVPDAIGPAARAAARAVDPTLAVVNLSPVAEVLEEQLTAPRFGVVASAIFGALGLGLATFGLFAMLSLTVAQRTREIGIRMALGATRRSVGTLIAWESVTMVAIGCLVGCLAAWLFARGLAAQLFGVTAHDEAAFAEAVVVLLLSALGAGFWPARRAMRVDPVSALRGD
jgi:putative ABC transport system permease protein